MFWWHAETPVTFHEEDLVARRKTRDNLGAWLVKCNPKSWDLERYLQDGHESIDDWNVTNGYRSAMTQPGDPVVMWVTGSKGDTPTPGIWGVGIVTSTLKTRDPRHPDREYWRDSATQSTNPYFVYTSIPVQGLLLDRDTVRNDPLLASLEVFSAPQMSNPNVITVQEWDRLRTLLGEDAPATASYEPSLDDDIDAPDPYTKHQIEVAAVSAVGRDLTKSGWSWESVEKDNVGWDITAHRAGELSLIEVKGRAGRSPVALLTPHELQAARTHPEWKLALVTNALASPDVTWHRAEEVIEAATPAVYRVSLHGSGRHHNS